MIPPLKTIFPASLLQFPVLERESSGSERPFALPQSPLKNTLPGGLIFDTLSQLTISGIRFQLVEIQTEME